MKELGHRQFEGTQVITPGHWIFAGIFVVLFIGVLIWAYVKDRPISRRHYTRSVFFLLSIILVLFLLYVFRQNIR